jgi:hypothetical protein
MSWPPEPPMWECWLEAVCGCLLAVLILVAVVLFWLVGDL